MLHFPGLQTITMPMKDASVQCSLLPAPPLLLVRSLKCIPDADSDSNTKEVTTEEEISDEDDSDDIYDVTDLYDTTQK